MLGSSSTSHGITCVGSSDDASAAAGAGVIAPGLDVITAEETNNTMARNYANIFDEMVVEGCGTCEINGTYKKHGTYDNRVAWYSKRGLWKRQHAILYIRRDHNQGRWRWRILMKENVYYVCIIATIKIICHKGMIGFVTKESILCHMYILNRLTTSNK